MMAVVKIHNADKLTALLNALPQKLVSDRRGGVVAKSMRKGANLIRKEERKTLQRAIDSHKNKYPFDTSTDLLKKNLKVRRKKYAGKGEKFTVGVGNKKYPGREGKKGATTALAGQRLERGTSKQAPTPWVAPAFAATAQPAIELITSDLENNVEKIAQAYLKK